MPTTEYPVINLIVVVIIVLIIACFFISFLVAFANQRKRKHQEEKINMTHNFQQEILKTQLEIQEQTLNNISQEIHDNIGQVLSLAKINLARIDDSESPTTNQRISDTRTLISKAIQDLRDLSKTINPEYIFDMGLARSVETELENINKAGLFAASLRVEGEVRKLGSQKELILFRIVQELMNNAMKYSQASNVEVLLIYQPALFILTLTDNGIGFDQDVVAVAEKPGLGMKTIRNRVGMIGATHELKTKPGSGTKIIITLHE